MPHCHFETQKVSAQLSMQTKIYVAKQFIFRF